MKKRLLPQLILFLALPILVFAQEAPVNYGPEWENIRMSYQKVADTFTRQRRQVLNDSSLSKTQKAAVIKKRYNQFMTQSRQLAVRRGEIIKIAAERSGLKYTLGSDPAAGRGMAGDIDLGGTPQQAKKFMREMKNLGIADAFDNVKSIQRQPGYVSIKVPMDVTVNYSGKLGQAGSSAHATQIRVDAFSKETYLSVGMQQNQPGRRAVEALDHLRKARQGLNVPASKMLGNPEALQVARINQTASALQQNPVSIGSAQAVLSSMVGNYQSLNMQLELIRPMVGQNVSQGPDNAGPPPLASLKSYQKRLAKMEAMLRPRYESAGYLMNNNKKIAVQIQAFKKRHAAYSAGISRYEGYLMQQQGAEATTALAEVRAAHAKIDAIKVPSDWQKSYVDQLTKHYFQIRELYRQVQDSAKFMSSVYPEPLGSYYDSLLPQTQDATGQMIRQWQASGQALKRFHNALGLLHAQVAAIVPEAQQDLAQTREEAVEYRDWDPSELRRELARLQALKRELGQRSEAAIADLNKAYFADRDALWQAYENAFKTPKLMACENCQTETLHSMDYSDNPPTVWCNACGRILSFMEWSGSGESLSQIRTRGQAKKAAILEQLATNRRAVDMAISQVKAAL